jgi:catecholate siderophore receptor
MSAKLPVRPESRSLIAAAVSLALGTFAGASSAQDSDADADAENASVLIEAERNRPYKVDASASSKYTTDLRDLPATLTAIPQSVMQAQGATTLRDVLRNTPGITFQAGEGGGGLPGDQNFTLRGFSARNALFIDGMRDPGSYARDPFNLEQVEVAKGPAAVVAGRSATAGAVNQVTKVPFERTLRELTLAGGNDDFRRVTADVNQPLGESAAGRLNLMVHDAGVPGRDVVENTRWGVAPSIAFGLGGDTRFTLAYLYMEQDNVPDYGLPWNTPAGPNLGIGLNRNNFYGLEDYDFEDIETEAATASLEHDFGERVAIESTLRYFDNFRDSAITAPRPPNRQLQRRTMGNELYASQTNLKLSLDAGGMHHTAVVGVEISREDTTSQNSAQATNQPPILDVNNPDPGQLPLGPMPANTGNPSEARVDTIAFYAFDTLELSKQWQITGGLRYDDYDVDYALTTLATGAVTELATSDGDLSWQTGLVYKPRENGSIYLAYGTSFDPSFDAGNTGVALVASGTAVNDPSLDPEESRNYELGTKWDLVDGRLGLTAAIFRTEKTNARTRDAATNEPVVLAGEQRVDGFEVSLAGSITDRWAVFGGYVYMDSEIVASRTAGESGSALVLTPESTFNLWTTFTPMQSLQLGVGTQFVDNAFRNATNTTTVPSYWLVDAMAEYAVTQRVTLQLNASNLADEKYVDRVGGGHFIPGPGRLVSLTARLTF